MDREAGAPAIGIAARVAGGGERARVAALLARAFQDDPAMSWIIPDPVARARRLPHLFGLLFDSDGAAGLRLTTAGGEAATLWRGPGRAGVSLPEMLVQAVPLLRALGGNLARALRVNRAVGRHMPDGRYWYLHVAGCDPAHHGRGHGGAAIQAGLSRVAWRLPCYLETATEHNLGFYARLGFAVTGDWRVGQDGSRFWSMLRPPD